MKIRLIIFFVFQLIAWTVYFNWGTSIEEQKLAVMAERVLRIEEMSASQFASLNTRKQLYKLILRNDGFFTRINDDESVENGLWAVNHEIPSLVLMSASGNQKYRILGDSRDLIQLELMNPNELIQTNTMEEKEPKLFSSIN
jgi:hypothetical protein